MADSQDPTVMLTAIQEALEGGDTRRLPVNRLLRDNYEKFSTIFARYGPAWGLLSVSLTKLGFTGRNGQPVSKHTLRSIWSREKARRAKLGKPKPASRKLQPVNEPVPEPGASPFPDTASTALDDLLGEMNKRSGRTST